MTEFTSELKRSGRPMALYIGLAVVAAALAGLFFVVRYQKNNPPPATSGPIAVPGMVRPGEPDFEAYKNKVRIEDVKASIGINFAGNRMAIINGILFNDGGSKLDAVEMRVTLYDVHGNLSKERVVTPLRPGIGLQGGPMEPLEKRTFTVGVESVEQLWNPKRVEIEITGIKYH